MLLLSILKIVRERFVLPRKHDVLQILANELLASLVRCFILSTRILPGIYFKRTVCFVARQLPRHDSIDSAPSKWSRLK